MIRNEFDYSRPAILHYIRQKNGYAQQGQVFSTISDTQYQPFKKSISSQNAKRRTPVRTSDFKFGSVFRWKSGRCRKARNSTFSAELQSLESGADCAAIAKRIVENALGRTVAADLETDHLGLAQIIYSTSPSVKEKRL